MAKKTKKMVKRKASPLKPLELQYVPGMLEEMRRRLELRYEQLKKKQLTYQKRNKKKIAKARRAGKKVRPTEMQEEMEQLEALHPTLGFVSNGIHVDCEMEDFGDDDE